jgi:hypothetical protein
MIRRALWTTPLQCCAERKDEQTGAGVSPGWPRHSVLAIGTICHGLASQPIPFKLGLPIRLTALK